MTKVGVFLAKIVAIVNQKGGVGKTTTCVNLTSSLKEKGNRVLLCDFDPQANATSGMGVDKAASRGVYDVLINGADVTASVAHTRYGDVLPSSKALAGAGIEMIDRENREFLLKQALDVLSPNYDFILIDCPPSLELLTVNALCAANSLIVPVQGEYFALEGLSDLMHTVRMVRRMALETLCGILGIYAVTVTVHALYNLMVSAGGAGTVLGYCLPAALIAAWKLWPAIRRAM